MRPLPKTPPSTHPEEDPKMADAWSTGVGEKPVKPDIMKMKVVELKAACTEWHQLTTGNKAHLRHRLLRLCRHIPWATPPPPGGTRAERAAGSFHAPGHADYATSSSSPPA